MKKNILILSVLLFSLSLLSSSCGKNSTSTPCDGKGLISFENKRDSVLVITVVQIHSTITLNHDQMVSQNLSGGTTYTFRFSGPAYTANLKDTTLLVQNCDNKLITIYPPTKK